MRTKDQELAYLRYAQSAPKVVAQFPNLFDENAMDKLRRQDIEIDKMTAELNAREEKERLKNRKPWYETLSQPKSKAPSAKQKGPGRNIAEERMAKQHAKQLQSFDRGNQIIKETQKKQQHVKVLQDDIKQIKQIADEQTQELYKQQKMHQEKLKKPKLFLDQVPELNQVRQTVKNYHDTTEQVIESRMQNSILETHQMQDSIKQQQNEAEQEVVRRMRYQRDAAQKTVLEFLDYQQQCEGLFSDGQRLKKQLKKLKTEVDIQEQVNLQLYHEINYMKAQLGYSEQKGSFQFKQQINEKVMDRLFDDYGKNLQYEEFKIQQAKQDQIQEDEDEEEDNNTFITLEISPQPSKRVSNTSRPSSGTRFKPKSAYIDKKAENLSGKMEFLLKKVNEQLFETSGDPDEAQKLLKWRNMLIKVQEALKVEAMLLQNNDRYRLRELQVRYEGKRLPLFENIDE